MSAQHNSAAKREPLALIASKAIMRMPISSAAKSVAAVLLDHVRWTDFRCDPGMPRLAKLSGLSRSNTQVAIRRLEQAQLLTVQIHGGRFGTNQYDFNWALLRQSDAAMQVALNRRGDPPRLAVRGASPVGAQTRSSNPRSEPEQHGARTEAVARPDRRKGHAEEAVASVARSRPPPNRVLPSRQELSESAAEARWSRRLTELLRSKPEVYGAVLQLIDASLSRRATEAERKRRGAGLRTIVVHLQHAGPSLAAALQLAEAGPAEEGDGSSQAPGPIAVVSDPATSPVSGLKTRPDDA